MYRFVIKTRLPGSYHCQHVYYAYYRLPVTMTGVPGLVKHIIFSTDIQSSDSCGVLDHLEVIACYG